MQKNWHFITYPKENIYYFLMKTPPKKTWQWKQPACSFMDRQQFAFFSLRIILI
jgi:hypothetical protein